MTSKLFHSLTILAMAVFAVQCQPLMAQPEAANGRNSGGVQGILPGFDFRVPSRVVSRQAGPSHPDPVALGFAKVKTYKFRSVDYPGGASADIWDFDHGTAVGNYGNGPSEIIAFYFHGKTYKTLSVPGAISTGVSGINASGQMVGDYTDSENKGHGFLYTGSSFVTIDYPQSVLTGAGGISDPGVIVGTYYDINDNYHGFVDNKGSLTTIDFPGASGTTANGINSSGDIVGSYLSSTKNEHGFLLSNGIYTTIDFPSSAACYPVGINDAGEIAGWFEDYDGTHGFTYSSGVFRQVDVPGAWYSGLYRIKNDGTVTGVAVDVLNERHGIVGH